MQKYNLHTIQLNETIDSIAKLYEVEKEDLIYFHNNHCLAKDSILIDITNQKELYIPRTAVIDRGKLVNFKNYSLIFNPTNFKQNYGVRIEIEKENTVQEIKYETSVKCIKTEEDLHYFEINRYSNVFINEEEVNGIADLLAYKTSKVLYPLYISTDKNGQFYQIENLELYQKRWNVILEDVYKEFEGEIVDKYIHHLENILINETELIQYYFKNDYFIRALFFGIYQNYGTKYRISGNSTFPIIENSNEPNYSIQLEIDPVLDDYDMIWIEGKGKLSEERTIEEFINQSPIAENEDIINDNGKIRLRYYLDNQTKWIESAYLECSILTNNFKKISISISKLDNQL